MTMHVFATIMALYPITPTSEIASEFGMTEYEVMKMAKKCRVKKSREYISEIKRKNGLIATEKSKKQSERRIRRTMKLLDKGYSKEEVAKRVKISVGTVYNYRLKWNKRSLNIKH